MDAITVRPYKDSDLFQMIAIWNEVVEDGIAFPQEELLDEESGKTFFAGQTLSAVAVEEAAANSVSGSPQGAEDASRKDTECDPQKIVGLYILHPNNVGRCGHICNASFAVSSECRGLHIGEKLVSDCIAQAKQCGFGILQFNAVVESNTHARHLYERLGFQQLGVIPNGFRMKDGHFENICPYFLEL
ncbi:MAG: GNAT family N-acetyltransferase [Lachnospiraceae bacterium]|nr:GNAT family N-acetyltransferase [Lachnospiraceae bacterium]